MSIRDEINNRIEEGRIFALSPLLPGESVVRPMFLSEEVHEAVAGPWEPSLAIRMAQLRGDLDAFLHGRMISMADAPFNKPKWAYMARTHPPRDEVWDIRVRDPNPGLRVLGCFAEPDVFVALVWAHRNDLGGPGDKRWRDFIERCKAKWRHLFPTYTPFSGRTHNDYVTENILSV